MIEILQAWLVDQGFHPALASTVARCSGAVALGLLSVIAHFIGKGFVLRTITRITKRTGTLWDDVLIEQGVFRWIVHLIPAALVFAGAEYAFAGYESLIGFTKKLANMYMLGIAILAIDAFLNSVVAIYQTYEVSRRRPIKFYLQVLKIILYISGAVIAITLVRGGSPMTFVKGLGALTAVTMLVFKDSILGFVAGIQLSMNDMVRRGDWIEVPKHSADGDVIDISLTTVKVQNWDKTISTIPPYALISESFKNWRGMSESGGRRIKRCLHIDMNSIRFCTPEMLERFSRVQCLSEYIAAKQKDIQEHNRKLGIDDAVVINGRRMTNVGTFRAYIEAYLRNHPNIHPDMTFLVRHLAPSANGLPIEIYVFSNDQRWGSYEAIQADIFDHLLAAAPEFGLRVFQSPTGADLRDALSIRENA